MLVVVGGTNGYALQSVEVVDLSGNNKTCSLPDIQYATQSHTMATLNQVPTFCGGTPGFEYT